jgi:spermidine synthase
MVLSVLVFGLSKPWRVPAWAGGVGAVFLFLYFLPSWNQHRLSIGPYNGVIFLAQNPHFRLSVDERLKSADLLYYREGVASTVTVEKNKRSSNLVLANNGKPDASSLDDLPTEQLIPQLPLLWFECSRRRPAHRAALIGLASGISAGAALRHSLDQLTVVELEPSMSQAASLFRDSNFNVLADPKFRLVTDDGRHYLKLHPGEFDAVISEPSNPWISGVSNLFTRESFQTARNALTQEGVFSQWVQIYEMRPEDFKTIVRTFHSVFPYTYVFGTYGFDNPTQFEGKNHGLDLILVGAAQPLVPDMEIMDRVIREEKLQKALERIGIQESGDLISLLRLGPSEVSKFEGEGPLNGDDNALIEFSAPLNLYKDTRQENLKELYKYQEDPTSQVGTKSKAELKKILLRVASEFDLYWKKDLADQMRDRARHL